MSKRRVQTGIVIGLVVVVIALILGSVYGVGKQMEPDVQIGVILTGEMDESGWNGSHYKGLLAACEAFDAQLLVKENVKEATGRCQEAVRELVEEGADLIILTSYGYATELEQVFEEYEKTAFYGITFGSDAPNMTAYFGRIYQVRYLSGMIAGVQSKNGQVGYVAAMPNPEVNRGINAFTLGVRRVNPDAKVIVGWTGAWDDEMLERDVTRTLIVEKGVDVITCHQNQAYTVYEAEKHGIYSIGYNEVPEDCSERCLTSVIWDWEALYKEILREFASGQANHVKRHWFDIKTGAIKLAPYSDLVSEEASDAVKAAIEEINNGKDVFSGEIYDNAGKLRCGSEEQIGDEALLEAMDWFVEGVEIYE